jgi:hypothetical protein
VDKFKYEFSCLSNLSREDIIAIQKPPLCEYCKTPIYNICIISQESDYQTRLDVYKQCGCGFRQDEQYTDFYDISVYTNLYGIYQAFSDTREQAFFSGIDFDEKEEEMAQ